MKKTLTIAFAFFVLVSYAQKPFAFKLKCHFSNIKADSVYLKSSVNSKTYAAAQIKDGTFLLEGELKYEQFYSLVLNTNSKNRYSKIYVEEGELEYSGEFGMYPVYDIKGGEIARKIYAFHKNPEYLKLRKEYLDVCKKKNTDENTIRRNQLRDELYKLDKSRFYTNWPDTDARYWYEKANYYYSKSDTAKFYETAAIFKTKFPKHYKNGWIDYCIKNLNKPAETSLIGSDYRNLILKDAQGNDVNLSDVLSENKLVLLDFWASWCAPCRGEFPYLRVAYKQYKEKGFEIYSVSLDREKKAWLKASQQENIPWINVVADKNSKAQVDKAYDFSGIPYNVLINNKGKITGEKLRGEELKKQLIKELK